MPAPRVNVLGWSSGMTAERIGSRLEFADDGRLLGLARTSGEHLVAGLGIVGATVDGRVMGPRDTGADIHPDEVDQAFMLGELVVRVRHNLDRTWQVRAQVTNPTDRTVQVERLDWEAVPGPEARVVVLATGAVAAVSFHQVAGPVLSLRLSRGELVADETGLTCPPLALGPGASWSLTLQGEWYADRRAVAAALPEWFPDMTLDQRDAEDFVIDHADAAVTWIGERGPGVRAVRVAEARGVSTIPIAVAPELGDEVARVVDAVADHGRARCAGEALVVAMAATLQVDRRCDDLLHEYADRSPDPPSALQAMVWARLASTGWPGMLDRALATADRLRPGPGTGLAAIALWAAARLEGCDEDAVGPRLQRLAQRAAPAGDPVSVVEASGLLGRRDARAEWEVELLCHADPGEAWPPRPDEELARAVAIRTLTGDPCAGLARRLLARCADRADARDNSPVLAWLGFVRP